GATELIGPAEPVAPALIETGPARPPVTVIWATPLTAVAVPRPVTVPVPLDWLNVTIRAASGPLAVVLLKASWMVAVLTRVVPAVRFVVAPVRAILAAAAGLIVSVWVALVRPPDEAVIVGDPATVSR